MPILMDKTALTAFMTDHFPQMAGDLRVEAVAERRLTMRLMAHDAHLRPGGTISGPSMFALADVAVYLAILALIGPVALAVTTSASIDFMRKPAAGADLLAEVRLLKLGRQLAVGDVLIYSEGGAEPVARATLTYAIPPAAKG